MPPTEEHITFGLPVSWRHPVRKLSVKFLWPHLRDQIEFNREVVAELEKTSNHIGALNDRVEDALTGHHAAIVRHDDALTGHQAAIVHQDEVLTSHHAAIVRQDQVLERFEGILEHVHVDIDRDLTSLEGRVNGRIELLQQQSFARYHESMGALRRDIAEVIQQFTELSSEISSELSDKARDLDAKYEGLHVQIQEGISGLQHEQGTQLLALRDLAVAASKRLDVEIGEQRVRFAALEMSVGAIRRTFPEPPPPEEITQIPNGMSTLMNALEDAVIPAPAILRERLSRYLAEARSASQYGPILELSPRSYAWLQMLKTEHISSYGVTSNTLRVEEGRDAGFDVRNESVTKHLRDIAPGSLGAISTFGHFDKLKPDEIVEVLDLSMTALHRNGALIIEGLDPASVVTAAHTVYIDNDNHLPIPCAVLSYFVRARGFVDLIFIPHDSSQPSYGSPSPGRNAVSLSKSDPNVLSAQEALSDARYYVLVAHSP